MNKFLSLIKNNKKPILVATAIILIIVLLVVFTLKLDDWLLKNYSTLNNPDIYDDMRTVIIDGEEYLPKDISSYLLIGVDKNVKIDVQTDDSEQADFLLYIICNHEDKTVTALQINRDTLTDVKFLNSINGSYRFTKTYQINLSHTFGIDEAAKALNTVDAFKALMNNVPVSYYFAFSMPLVTKVADTIGETNVTITADAACSSLGYNEGDVVTIQNGTEALDFVRERTDNVGRMARQRLYMNEVYKKFQSDTIDFEKLLDQIEDYMATNITDGEFESFYNSVTDYTFNGIVTLDGTVGTMQVGEETWATYEVTDATVNKFLTTYCYDVR